MLNKLKKIRFTDITGIFIFLIVLVPSFIKKLIIKLNKRELWLICETKTTARDNGYVFYKYIREKHPDINAYYAIDKNSNDYNKVSKLGNIIKWGSFKHYYYYMSSTKNISSHKEGNPNQLIFTILHLYLNLYNNRVFLQHGIIKDDLPMFYFKNTKFKYFICGAQKEYEYVKKQFGYKNNQVICTGLARFDNLHDDIRDDNMILFIPTWRRWLNNKNQVLESNYYKNIVSFINDKKLENILEKNDKYLYFYPHQCMQPFMDNFKITNKRVKMYDINNFDIQLLLKKGSLLVTDYSSVYFDFAYMGKPIIYFQPDYTEYREKHMLEGYFNYEKDGFGDICYDVNSLIKNIENCIKKEYKVNRKYKKRMDDFFVIKDAKNCERIYNEIIK